ncbi:hypothetical protein [Corynebacterium sp. Marseille-P3884]|uniref:hypothetical protein n=1 Tax=Corynebacterium sp. Marseille-P3884 TaxID=2495409 RepID=UPI001B32C6DB|nr:hypothetical protein [Corynebacterium sp. Marseille-P3884]MBP3947876.1 hypothetical protein [Corynebacterium sp. Marseille-P3884]
MTEPGTAAESRSPAEPNSSQQNKPPRLTDFKVLRLPLLELCVLGVFAYFAYMDINYMTGGNGLITFFVLVPLTVVMILGFFLTIPFQRGAVTSFGWDIMVLVVGALGLWAWVEGVDGIAFGIGILPVAVSLFVRRLIAFILWKLGVNPRARRDSKPRTAPFHPLPAHPAPTQADPAHPAPTQTAPTHPEPSGER